MEVHVRFGNLEKRRESAKVRQLAYDKLSILEKIDKLDKKYGKGLGAVKQRARLLKQSSMPKPEPKRETVKVQKTPKEKFNKKYNKKEERVDF